LSLVLLRSCCETACAARTLFEELAQSVTTVEILQTCTGTFKHKVGSRKCKAGNK